MSIAIAIAVTGLEKGSAKLLKFRESILGRINRMLEQIAVNVEGRSRENYLSGPRPEKLGTVSGSLKRSIGHRIEGNSVIIGSNLIYAPVHEFGATILPIHGDFLTFKTLDGQFRKVRSVTIPARPFLTPALNDAIGAGSILNIVSRNVEEAKAEAFRGD